MNHWNNQLPRDPDSMTYQSRTSPMIVAGDQGARAAGGHHCEQVHSGCLPQPYPNPVAQCPCETSIRLIRGVYCGVGFSELSTTMQYFYHSMELEECAPQASKDLMAISICEMRHLHLLGKLLCSMNSNPKFYAPRRSTRGIQDCWWSAQPPSVCYADRLREALCADIDAEQTSIMEYRKILQQCNDTGIVPLIERILLDEEEHLRIFTALLQRLCG